MQYYKIAKVNRPCIELDYYSFKEGLYLRVNLDESWEEQKSKFDLNHIVVRKKEELSENNELVNWFKRRDYFSELVDMNKPVDPKKQVHSNNPFSLFMKKDVFESKKGTGKYTTLESIERYLQATYFEEIRKKWGELVPKQSLRSKNIKEQDTFTFFRQTSYKMVLEYLEGEQRKNLLNKIYEWYLNNLNPLSSYLLDIPFSNYIRLYFMANKDEKVCEEIYSLEYLLYIIPKIYNKNDYNQIIGHEIMGLPSFDISMNEKKPYTEHLTMQIKAPDRVTIDDALYIREMAECIKGKIPPFSSCSKDYGTFFYDVEKTMHETTGSFHIYLDGKSKEVHYFENVPFSSNVTFDIAWENVLQRKDNDGNLRVYEYDLKKAGELQRAISKYFFSGRLTGAFLFDDLPKAKAGEFTATMASLFGLSRQGFYDLFTKGVTISLKPIFRKVSIQSIVEQLLYLEKTSFFNLIDAFNLQLCIRKYIGDEGGMEVATKITQAMDSLREKLQKDSKKTCESDAEFYFLSGQVASFLASQSEAAKKTGALYEPYLRAKSAQQIKKSIEHNYMLYKYKISLNQYKFNRALTMIFDYSPEEKERDMCREMLLAGLFANNLLYEKSKEE